MIHYNRPAQKPQISNYPGCIYKPDYVIVTWFGQIFDMAM
jgi:hypothetical protein